MNKTEKEWSKIYKKEKKNHGLSPKAKGVLSYREEGDIKSVNFKNIE